MDATVRKPLVAVTEIATVLVTALAIIAIGWRIVGEGAFARQVVVWTANVAMLVVIGASLRRRGQQPSQIGLRRLDGWRPVALTILGSVIVLVVALVAFVAGGAIVSGASGGAGADLSDYGWLIGNTPMLILALAAVWIVSSFGEEVVYRGFLMDRLAEAFGTGRAAWAAAAFISAMVFGLAHFAWGFVGIVQTTFMGLALAASYLVFRLNLWPLVLAHVWMDTLLLVQVWAGAPPTG